MAASNPITTDQQVVCLQDSHPVLVEIPDAVGLLASGEGQVRDAQGALVYSVALAADQGAGLLSGEIPALAQEGTP